MTRRLLTGRAALLVVALLLPGLLAGLPWGLDPAQPVGQAAGQATLPNVTYTWWDERWHLRVPVRLEPIIPDRLNGGSVDLKPMKVPSWPVRVEVDFGEATRLAGPEGFGWPRDAQGRLASFTLDTASIRVVEYDLFKGCALVVDRITSRPRCMQGSDRLIDALVPATFGPGRWDNPESLDAAFHPQRNPVATLQWLLRGAFTQSRLYFVYYDILENGAKDTVKFKPEQTGVLEGLHYVRWGTDIIGYAPGAENSPEVLMAQALYDNTTIAISKYIGRGVEPAVMVNGTIDALFSVRPSEQRLRHPSCEGVGVSNEGTMCLEVAKTDRFFFRVQANRPVLVGLRMNVLGNDRGPTWYPSSDGGLAGTEFQFRALASTNQGAGGDGGPAPAPGGDGGEEVPMYVISAGGSSEILTITGATLPPSETGMVVQGARALTGVTAGTPVHITATRPILVLSTGAGDDFGYNLVGPYGAPTGARMVGFLKRDLTLVNLEDHPAKLLLGNPMGDPDSPRAMNELRLDPGPGNASYTTGCSCSGTLGEVWEFTMAGDDRLWGKAGERGLVPIGGKDGTEFQVSLQHRHDPVTGNAAPGDNTDPVESRLILVGQYNATRVVVTNSTSGKEQLNTTISVNDWVDTTSSGKVQVPYGDWRVKATKPIAAYLYGPAPPPKFAEPDFSLYYSAQVEPPRSLVGPGEFHGFAVGWEEKVRTAAVAPGERVRLKLNLTNLGRGVGAQPTIDTFTIGREVRVPENTTAPIVVLSSVLEADVPSFASRTITLSVEVPADAKAGTVYQVDLTARSKGNANFTDTIRVVVTVQIRFEFQMRFLETNSTAIQKIIQPEAATCMDIEVRNTGTGDATIRLQMTPTQKSPGALGFEPLLLARVVGACTAEGGKALVDPDGRSVEPLRLAPGQASLITLYVKAPPGTQPLPLEVEVQGVAVEDASASQQVSATVLTNVEAKVRLTAFNDTQPILPGQNATYRVLVENIGGTITPVDYGVQGLLPEGWAVAFLGAPPVLLGPGTVDQQGKPLDRGEFTVNITASLKAPVGLLVPVNLVATSTIIIEAGDTSKAFRQSDTAKVTATVVNNFTLELPDVLPVTIDPGEPFPLEFTAGNAANGPFTLVVAPGALPKNWTLRVREPVGGVTLQPGDRVTVRLEVQPPVATKAGLYEININFAIRDPFTQGAAFRNQTVLVRSTVAFRADAGLESILLPPGSQRQIDVRLTNTGNLPALLRVSAEAPPGYRATLPERSRVALEPGAEATIPVVVGAPGQPPSLQAPALKLTILDENSNKRRELSLPILTGTVDLVVTQVAAVTQEFRVGQPAAVAATVQNLGTIPASNVAVALVIDGKGVRNETLRSLPPGEPRVVTLPWTVDGPPREAVVVIDPDNVFIETDEANNQARVDLGRDLPGFEASPAILAVGLAALLAWASRRGPRRGGHG